MLSQTTAFLTRSIRQESRLLSHHLVRSGMVLVMLYAMAMHLAGSRRLSASGLSLIGDVLHCCYWCLALVGVMYFSVAITEEKEEETLPLLRMTGVRNFTLLIGKSLPRLAVVVLLLLVSAPFLMLAVTLGGVVPEQIVASLLGFMCYAFCLSQAGLFASTVCNSSSRAVSATFILWLLLEFGAWLFYWAGDAAGQWGLDWIGSRLRHIDAWLWERTMWSASDEYLSYDRGDRIWGPQMTFHLAVGIMFFGLSWALFELCNQHAIAQGSAASVKTARGLNTSVRAVRPLRCWDAALEWKSWQFIVGGRFWFWTWMITLPYLSIAIVIVISVAVGHFQPAAVYGGVMMLVGTATFAISLARLLGNVLNQEIHQQTLVSLCMLPRSLGEILRRLLLGLMPFLLAPLSCFVLGLLWTAANEPLFTIEAIKTVRQPWLWATLGWVVVTAYFGILLSVYFRHGGMLTAVAICWFLLPFMGGMLIALLAQGGGQGTEEFFLYVVPTIAMFIQAAICIGLHQSILRRLETLAGK